MKTPLSTEIFLLHSGRTPLALTIVSLKGIVMVRKVVVIISAHWIWVPRSAMNRR